MKKHERKGFWSARRKRILDAWGHSCAVPKCRNGGPFELDHVVAIARGGTDEDENVQPLCRRHHLAKTHGTKHLRLGADGYEIRKTVRMRKKNNGTYRPSKHRLGDGKWKKKVSGEVVRRNG